MKKLLFISIVTLSLLACSENKTSYNLHIEGRISDLKLGKIYLQAVRDSSLVNLDSAKFEGKHENFKLKAQLEEPELMLLVLKKHNNDDYIESISFFAEEGTYNIEAKVTDFTKAKISSTSRNQEKLEELRSIIKGFNNQDLELVEEEFKLKSQNKNLDDFEKKKRGMERRRYLYLVNFALKNKDLELAPFTLLSEGNNLNIKYLDTVYTSLDQNIKRSKYGIELKELIEYRKQQQENATKETIEQDSIQQPTST